MFPSTKANPVPTTVKTPGMMRPMPGGSGSTSLQMGPPIASGSKSGARFNTDNVDTSQWFDPRKLPKGPVKPWHEWTLSQDFEIGKPLGEGRFGHVYLARTVRDKRYVALKVLHSKQIEKDKIETQVNRETEIHIDLDHPNIVKMFGYFRDGDKIVFVLDYAPGRNVYSELGRQPECRFPELKAATYIVQVIHALEYLHQRRIIHRDIKPENLLIGFRGEIKMADFGCSVKGRGGRMIPRKTMCGTLDYMPPEMVKRVSYDEKVDLWSLGVLTYEFIVGRPPFEEEKRGATFRRIRCGQVDFPPFVSPIAQSFVGKLIIVDPNQRLNLGELRKHPFLRHALTAEEMDTLLPMFQKMTPLLPMLKHRYEQAAEMSRKLEKENESTPESTVTGTSQQG